jgi:hypothetical protein
MEQYLNFLTSKIKVAEKTGVDIDTTLLHSSTKPHQRDIIDWSLSLGRALIAADCGMGKSHMAIESFRMLHLLQDLDSSKKLSRSFTTLPMQSNTDFIWNDVNRMHGLNMEQSSKKQQNHICPMPFDQVDRLIELYSNKGDLILEPFAGLGTTGVRAIKKERKAYLCELNDVYARCAATYLKEAEYRNELPTLFDMITDKVAV